MKSARTLRIAASLAATIFLGSLCAQATVVERVVAVVGEQAILFSELRARSRPFLLQIHQRFPPGPQQAAQESEVYRQMLTRMIDDKLLRQAADKQRINVTQEEVDGALERLAGMQNLTMDQLMAEAIHSGFTAQEYREEIRRQVLEGKMLELRVKGRVRVTDEDLRNLYARVVREERQQLGYQLQWIVLRVTDTSAEGKRERRAMAELLANQAKAGADFASLARQYSDDTATRDAGGNLGRQRPGALDEVLERTAMGLEVGQVSTPLPFGDAFVVLRVAGRDPSRFGTFDEMRDQLGQRAYGEQLEKAKRQWLEGMKRGAHIETRL